MTFKFQILRENAENNNIKKDAIIWQEQDNIWKIAEYKMIWISRIINLLLLLCCLITKYKIWWETEFSYIYSNVNSGTKLIQWKKIHEMLRKNMKIPHTRKPLKTAWILIAAHLSLLPLKRAPLPRLVSLTTATAAWAAATAASAAAAVAAATAIACLFCSFSESASKGLNQAESIAGISFNRPESFPDFAKLQRFFSLFSLQFELLSTFSLPFFIPSSPLIHLEAFPIFVDAVTMCKDFNFQWGIVSNMLWTEKLRRKNKEHRYNLEMEQILK